MRTCDTAVSRNRRPHYTPKNTVLLILGMPNKVILTLGNPIYRPLYSVILIMGTLNKVPLSVGKPVHRGTTLVHGRPFPWSQPSTAGLGVRGLGFQGGAGV